MVIAVYFLSIEFTRVKWFIGYNFGKEYGSESKLLVRIKNSSPLTFEGL